jgi:hypothetical protein
VAPDKCLTPGLRDVKSQNEWLAKTRYALEIIHLGIYSYEILYFPRKPKEKSQSFYSVTLTFDFFEDVAALSSNTFKVS